jgi:polyisoprenoid-binding protein YceI
MRIAYVLAVALVSTAAVAQAPSSAPGARNLTAVTGGLYAADPSHTLIIWTLDHFGFSPYSGIFGDVTGTLRIDPKRPNAAAVDVTIPVSKVVTASAGLTEHLLRDGAPGAKPDFFGAQPPNARFVSTRVVARGRSAKIHGNLTLNRITRPVILDASFYGAGIAPGQAGREENIGFRATAGIRRSDFGLGFLAPALGDHVKLEISAAFHKQAS